MPPKSLEPNLPKPHSLFRAKANSSDSIIVTRLASCPLASSPGIPANPQYPCDRQKCPLSVRHAKVTFSSGRDLCQCPAQSQSFSDISRWWRSTWYCWVRWGKPQNGDTLTSHHLNKKSCYLLAENTALLQMCWAPHSGNNNPPKYF